MEAVRAEHQRCSQCIHQGESDLAKLLCFSLVYACVCVCRGFHHVDVCVFMREVESCVRQLGVEEVEVALRGEAAPTGAAVADVETRALVVYEGPAAGDGVPVPPAVTEGVAVAGVEMGAVVVYEGPAAGDGGVTQVGVLATLDDEPQGEAGQIVPAGSVDSTALAQPGLCYLPLQMLPPDDGIPWLPWAGSGARQSRRRADMVRAWVRDQLQHKHRLPRDLPLCYIGEKVLCRSDMNLGHARLLLPAPARGRLCRAFLYPFEIAACGFNTNDPKPITIPGVRATPTTFPGVPLSVYVSSGRRGRGQCKSDRLKLNKFHRNDATVINGQGYRSFMVDCGLEAGDGVEVWAFRWPPGIRPCLLIAKKDGVRARARNP
ncbi:hypothetical protein VPH35_092963 [Triticum aestivum]